MRCSTRFACWFLVLLAVPAVLLAQRKGATRPATSTQPDIRTALPAKAWRSVGPFRGGRSIAVAGHASQPNTYYFGATGGGIWKTTNGGVDWQCVSDSFLRRSSSVGAMAVAPSDPNTVWAGMGERDIRGNMMTGDGVYRSQDAGATWQHMGLEKAGVVGRIVVHPQDANTVYAAVLGQVFGKPGRNPERGVYRTRDGGKSWQRVLFVDDTTGAVHLAMDPSNPRILYASMWAAWRAPWAMSSGGASSGLYRSTDGGDTWENISRKPGLPKGILGKIGVSVSPADPKRIYAVIENENGGVFRSDDGGETWTRTTADRNTRQRAWYYSHIHADPQDPNTVYVLNVNMLKSTDGGKTFQAIRVGHGDTHDLWIDPANPQRMVLGDDGGAEVSLDGGSNWTELDLPTAQFYHVTLDNAFPYRMYGAQQDNSTISIPHRTFGYGGIGRADWRYVAGCECGYIAVDPRNPDITYGGCYDGYLERQDYARGQTRPVNVFPESNIGAGADAYKYRWQWTYPILFSPHDPGVLYTSSQFVHRSTDEGRSWQIISPDLTRADPATLRSSGGPITQDNTGVEVYATVFALAESPVQKGLLWAGSDDGLVHISRDGGANWRKITPPGLPEWATVSIIEPSPFDAGTAYLAAQRYRLGDEKPYLYRTTDYGATWTRIDAGIPEGSFTHVVRADPNRKGLLYAGTERGVYVSLNDGAAWQPLQLNLPVTPVRDLAVHPQEKDLVAATHGRSFWVLDDLTPLHQLSDAVAAQPLHLYAPRHTYRVPGTSAASIRTGQNPPNGVLLHYWLKSAPGAQDTLHIEFRDRRDSVVARFNHRQDPAGKAVTASKEFFEDEKIERNGVPPARPGLNRFVWNLRYADLPEVPGAILWAASNSGPRVAPGTYTVHLRLGNHTQQQRVEVRPDPRAQMTPADIEAQNALAQRIYAKGRQVNEAVNRLRDTRKALDAAIANVPEGAQRDSVTNAAKPLRDSLSAVEEQLISTKLQAGQDILNYGIRLNNKLLSLLEFVEAADAAPTQGMLDVYADLAARIDVQLRRLDAALAAEVPKLNALVRALNVPALPVGK